MKKITCLKCGEELIIGKIEKGVVITCICGSTQQCIDKDEYISRWRIRKERKDE